MLCARAIYGEWVRGRGGGGGDLVTHLPYRSSRTRRRSCGGSRGTMCDILAHRWIYAHGAVRALLCAHSTAGNTGGDIYKYKRDARHTIIHVSFDTPFPPFCVRKSNHHCVYSSGHPALAPAPSIASSSSPSSSELVVCDSAPPASPWGRSRPQSAMAVSRPGSCALQRQRPCPCPAISAPRCLAPRAQHRYGESKGIGETGKGKERRSPRLRCPSARAKSNVCVYTFAKYAESDPSCSRRRASAACIAGSVSALRAWQSALAVVH